MSRTSTRRARHGSWTLAAATATAAAVALTMTACGSGGTTKPAAGGNSGSGSGKISLTAMDYFTSEPQHSAVGAILQSCAAAAGVSITQQSVANPQLMPKVLQQLSSHTLPDLLMLDNPNLQQIAQTGALTPLDSAGVDLTGYYPSILAAGTYQGKVYGLAPAVNSIALIYNKDMLSAAGIKPPTTWAELTADATKLTTPKHYGFAFSADNDGEGAWNFLPFFWSNGGDLQHLDASGSVGALQQLTSMVKSGSVSKSVVTWAQSDVNDQFIAGKAAMMINGPWQFPTLDAAKSLHYGVAAIPVPKAGDPVKVPLGGEVWTVPVTTTAKEKAAAKVLACMNNSANQISYAQKVGEVPSLETAAAQLRTSTPAMAPFVTEVSTALSRTAEVGTRFPAIQTAIETALQSALTGSATPQQAMTTAQSSASSAK